MRSIISPENRKRAGAIGVATSLSLGLAACGGEPQPSTDTEATIGVADPGTKSNPEDFQDFDVSHYYTDTGKRITLYGAPTVEDVWGYITDSIAYCDGRDLVEMPLQYRGDGGNSTITRSVGHAACLDGILTPSDFGEAN